MSTQLNIKLRVGILQRESPAIFLWVEQNMTPLSKEDQLRAKQQLFFDHEATFSGTLLPISQAFRRLQRIDGVTLSSELLVQLPELLKTWATSGRFQIAAEIEDIVALLIQTENLVKTEEFIPTQYGTWAFKKQPPLLAKATLGIDILTEEKHELIQHNATSIVTDLLIEHVIEKKRHLVAPLLTDHDERVRSWAESLLSKGDPFELPIAQYKYCLQKLGYVELEPFQTSLTIYEPNLFSDRWTIEVMMTEIQTKKTLPVSNLIEGDHPFLQNPIPYLKKNLETLTKIPVLADVTIHYSRLSVTDEEIYTFLHSYQAVCEESGIAVFVPQSWERTLHLSVTAEVTPLPTQRGPDQQPVSWFFSLQNEPVEEAKIRQWVEEQRHFITFNNRWMRWDLQKAAHYLKQIDQLREERPLSLLEAIRKVTEQSILQEEPADNEEAFIEWKMPDHWLQELKKISPPLLPSQWASILKSYQMDGVKWLTAMRKLGLGCCLADDMGLGKTVQAIAYCDTVIKPATRTTKPSPHSPILIVCPTSVLENWKREFETFAPHLCCTRYYGAKPKRETLDIHNGDVILTTYALLLRDEELFCSVHWEAIIFDEAQMIKNKNTKLWHSAKKLAGEHRIAISGTPVENHLGELWSIFDWLNEGYLGTLSSFSKRFDGKQGEDEENPFSSVKTVVEPFVLRRTKQEQKLAWHLPEKKEAVLYTSLTQEQRTLYQAVVEDTIDTMHDLSPDERKGVFFRGMTHLKQICNHPAHYLDERQPLAGRSGKWNQFIEKVADLLIAKKRIVIFTQYKKMGYLIQQGIKEAFDLEVAFLNGAMSMNNRYETVNKFNNGKTAPILLVSIRAGGTGLNMTGATEVIHYDRWWNPAVDQQASDRVYRIGQKKQVTIHSLTTKETIEESIEAMLDTKKAMYQSLFQTSNRPVWEMSEKELASLFYGR